MVADMNGIEALTPDIYYYIDMAAIEAKRKAEEARKEHAAWRAKSGLAAPTEITPKDVEHIGAAAHRARHRGQ
jgi:hypothetical protein